MEASQIFKIGIGATHTAKHEHTHTSMCALTHRHTHTHMHTDTHSHTCTHTHTHTCTQTHTHTHTYAHMHTHTKPSLSPKRRQNAALSSYLSTNDPSQIEHDIDFFLWAKIHKKRKHIKLCERRSIRILLLK